MSISPIIQHLKMKFKMDVLEILKDKESQEYEAQIFKTNTNIIYYRKAKITPTKNGQFVTFWKRNTAGIIEPFHEDDSFDFLIIKVQKNNDFSVFVFPKIILKEKGIISTKNKEGKRALRVYPIWDKPESKQAEKSQNWQLKFFESLG